VSCVNQSGAIRLVFESSTDKFDPFGGVSSTAVDLRTRNWTIQSVDQLEFI